MIHAIGIGLACAALLLARHDRPAADAAVHPRPAPPPTQELDVAERLPGTWLREQREPGVQTRRLLQLDPDGQFRERVRIAKAGGQVIEQEHAGTWYYDGTNLKRKYTLMDGQPPSRLRMPFATFEIRLDSRDTFVGTDHIHRNTVRYDRVAPETAL